MLASAHGGGETNCVRMPVTIFSFPARTRTHTMTWDGVRPRVSATWFKANLGWDCETIGENQRDPSVPGSCHCETRSVIIGWRLLIQPPPSFFLQTSIVKIICFVEIPSHTHSYFYYMLFSEQTWVYRVVYIGYSTFSNHMYVVSTFFPTTSIYGYMQKRERESERERERGGGLLLLQCGIYKVASRMMLYLCFIAHDVSGHRSYSSVHSYI